MYFKAFQYQPHKFSTVYKPQQKKGEKKEKKEKETSLRK